MRLILPLCLLALGAAPPAALPKKPAPNTLTAQQVRRGEVLLFDGETTFGWKVVGDVKVDGGVLVLGGTQTTLAEPTLQMASYSIRFQSDWTGEKPPLIEWNSALVPRFNLTRAEQGRWSEQLSTARGADSPARRLVRFTVPAGSTLRLRNVKALPLGTTPLFNGRDLSGWKESAYRK